jgi:2-dehydro-3-deoxyphosphooctonate aldolase (KDO 8-P synthase)
MAAIARTTGVPIVFKSSFDKANRTSHGSFRGPGIDQGLRALERVKRRDRITGAHGYSRTGAGGARGSGRRYSANPGTALAPDRPRWSAAAVTGRVVNLKKGQFLAPWDMQAVVRKAEDGGQSAADRDRARFFVRL